MMFMAGDEVTVDLSNIKEMLARESGDAFTVRREALLAIAEYIETLQKEQETALLHSRVLLQFGLERRRLREEIRSLKGEK